jgi:hypothetical protein
MLENLVGSGRRCKRGAMSISGQESYVEIIAGVRTGALEMCVKRTRLAVLSGAENELQSAHTLKQ